MGKLIDADVFDSVLQDAQAECKKNSGNFRFGVLNSVRANLANQPAVDAVPMTWLRDKLLDMPNADEALSKAAWRVMRAWEMEQEAQDGT